MANHRHLIQALTNSTSVFRQGGHPYYIVTPGFTDRSAGIRLLHELCSLLNKLGFEAYVDTADVSGSLWTPTLTPSIKKAHFAAGRKPIVIYPEVTRGHPMGLGLPVRYALYFPGRYGSGVAVYPEDEIVFKHRDLLYPSGQELHLPIVDLDLFAVPSPAVERDITLVYYNRYNGPLQDHGENVVEISSKHPVPHKETANLYRRAKVMYAYEGATATIEARLCGCPVVLVPNDQKLKAFDEDQTFYGTSGLAWGTEPEALAKAQATVSGYRAEYEATVSRWKEQFIRFIESTQALAEAQPFDDAWPQAVRDYLPGVYTESADLAARADRLKWARIHQQYVQWSQRSTLREIDASIYAEHAANGNMRPLSVVIDHRHSDGNRLADTLDSLFDNLWKPAELVIVAHEPAPEALEGMDGIVWLNVADAPEVWANWQPLQADALLVESGSTLNPAALAEWGLAHLRCPNALMVYADEDVHGATIETSHPFFKPDCNIELLRCMNYLGSATLVNGRAWLQAGRPLFDGALYGVALAWVQRHGRAAIGHIDRILVHSAFRISTGQESQEFNIANQALTQLGVAQRLRPLERWGTWLVEHMPAQDGVGVSLVVPSGPQTGYLRSLLKSLDLFPEPQLKEVIVVCHESDAAEIQQTTEGACSLPVRLVVDPNGEYSHGRRLNMGIEAASGDYILVCDDDTEPLHSAWLQPLLAIAVQADVGCVAPRLIHSKDPNPKVVGGPAFLGIQGTWAPYNGEEGRYEEVGVYSRLQLTQDVSTVAGHFFLVKKSAWQAENGFNAENLGVFFPILDFCLRLNESGMRHVWTPLSNAVHHGGKTIELVKKDARCHIQLAESELTERETLLERWSRQLACDRNYNRHLSLFKPFDIEQDLVIDWEPTRSERPKVLSTTVHSGSGQYRIIEPLHGLQEEGLAQTCVVLPLSGNRQRILQPLEVVRSGCDTLVLQHSLDDGQLTQIPHYRRAMPGLLIVQMVDDLFGEVPEKHPNRQFQSREGHQRMMRALMQSDRLVVTTQTLKDHYDQYVSDVRVVPNTLRDAWFGNRTPPRPRERLRVGWVGAAQHQGDLDMIASVIEATAEEFDWVFMGMCTDRIKPLIKEFHDFVSIAEYPQKVSTLDLDIAIAPLENNIFNRCKSNLRLLEYGAMCWPVVCSDVYPYQTENPPVIRCANDSQQWVKELRKLAGDRELRQKLGFGLNRWVRDNYYYYYQMTNWLEAVK